MATSEEEEAPWRRPGEWLLLCEHEAERVDGKPPWYKPGECEAFECRAEVWLGPEGLTAADLRYSVVISIDREWRVGDYWGKPDKIPGVKWKFNRREKEEDGWTSFVYGAAMDFPAFLYLMQGYEEGSESGGILYPAEAPNHLAPSCVFHYENDALFVTAWPKVRYEFARDDAHLFDEWDEICFLLTGKPAWPARDD